jgi:hypothetical protein
VEGAGVLLVHAGGFREFFRRPGPRRRRG